MTKPTFAEITYRFTYQPPRVPEQRNAHERVSHLTRELALALVAICPDGRNLSLALTHLEDVRMRANAAVALDWTETPETSA